MKSYVVTEGPFDVQLLRGALPEDAKQGVEFIAAGGVYRVKSIAASLLISKHVPVAAVFDSDHPDPKASSAIRRDAEHIIRMGAGALPTRVLVAVPTIEALLFEPEGLVESVLHQPLTDELRIIARYEPKEALRRLLPSGRGAEERFLERLTPADWQRIGETALVRELTGFLRSAEQPALVGAAA